MLRLNRQRSSDADVSPTEMKRLIFALVGIGVAVAVAISALLLREAIVDGVNQVRDRVLTTVGLGIVPIAVWIVGLVAVLVVRPQWLKRFNIWIASALAVAALMGVFSFFRPYDGFTGWFALYGQITLGGGVGDAIIGSDSWVGAVRVFALFIVALAVALPRLSADIGAIIGQGVIFVYLSLFMAVRSLLFGDRLPELDEPEFDATPADQDRARDRRYAYQTSNQWADDIVGEERGSGRRFSLPEFATYLNRDQNEEPTGSQFDEEEDYEPETEPPVQSGAFDVDDYDDPPFDPDPRPALPAYNRADELTVDTYQARPENGSAWTSEALPGTASATLTALPDRPRSNPAPKPLVEPTAHARGSSLMWQRPDIDLLKTAPENSISREELESTAATIVQTLAEYGIEVEVGHVRPGPTVTMYGLVPGWIRKYKVVKQVDEDGRPLRDENGKQVTKRVEQKTRVKVDSILAREKDLSLALKTPSLRIETPAMGKSLVGIEVPNPSPSLVTLRKVMESSEFQKLRTKAHLPIALGRGSGGEAVVFDLAKMPHLLVAGATGSGKSVCLNAIVSCLITEKTPAEMRLLLVDPKRVELTPYNGIPHLMAPVVVETDTVVGYLKGLIREMFDRYRRMEEVGVRNIEAYNKRMPDKMPFLCIVVDELADLMMTAAFDVEQSLCRLAQLGRATGIHLIIATQRPSVDVVTGLIKANFPSRISFGVTSQVDSRTILDTAGADKLLGRGDMLYLPLDASKPSRVQNVFVGDQEIEELVHFWQSTPWPAIQRIDLLGGDDLDDDDDLTVDDDPDRDEMMDKAIELAMSHRKLSTSLLQRRLRIGYPRAARLMDQLEDEGIVGPGDGSKSRDVIINQN